MSDNITSKATIVYNNYRGEIRMRVILPLHVHFGRSLPYHPRWQWLLEAIDLEKGEPRTFAMEGISSWKELAE